MASAEILKRAERGIEHIALELAAGDAGRRTRRAMRVNPLKKTPGGMPATTVVGGAALLGFCLGWKAFRLWHD